MTQLEKMQFFALYWGQKVLYNDRLEGKNKVNHATLDLRHAEHDDYLLLKPLSSITDEHALQFGYTQTPASFWGEPIDQTPSMCFCAELSSDGIDFENVNWMEFTMIDKLRAMGYAVGWKEYGVQDLIKEGIVKLQECMCYENTEKINHLED
jgi:hypothetical protein